MTELLLQRAGLVCAVLCSLNPPLKSELLIRAGQDRPLSEPRQHSAGESGVWASLDAGITFAESARADVASVDETYDGYF